jgi:hypothetical protein
MRVLGLCLIALFTGCSSKNVKMKRSINELAGCISKWVPNTYWNFSGRGLKGGIISRKPGSLEVEYTHINSSPPMNMTVLLDRGADGLDANDVIFTRVKNGAGEPVKHNVVSEGKEVKLGSLPQERLEEIKIDYLIIVSTAFVGFRVLYGSGIDKICSWK